MKRILHISPDFNYSCGVSKLVFFYLKYFGSNNEYEIHFITNGGDSLDRLIEISSLKYEVHAFSKGIKNIFYQKKFQRELKQYILKNQIALIHTHHRFPEFVSVKVAKELKIKTITSAHSFVSGYKGRSFKSDKIISVSNSVTSYLSEKYGLKSDKIIMLYNPVENLLSLNSSGKEVLKTELGIKPDQIVLLYMGRININKGYDNLLKSFKVVKEKIKDVILLMCGSVEDKKFNKTLAHSDNSVIFLSPRKDNHRLYSIADVVILPSRVEPFPYVMLEAGIYKKPFIGGNTGGIAEFIEDNKNGLLVDPENFQQLADRIIYLLNNPEIGELLGSNLNRKTKELCDYKNYFAQVEEIYNSLLNPA